LGHKVHPTGFRVGVIYDWQSKWYASEKNYKDHLHSDIAIRKRIMGGSVDAGISRVSFRGHLLKRCAKVPDGGVALRDHRRACLERVQKLRHLLFRLEQLVLDLAVRFRAAPRQRSTLALLASAAQASSV
jgi:hypothetical protein